MVTNDTEEIVRELLERSYNQHGFRGNNRLVDYFVAVVNDPSLMTINHASGISPAVEYIQAALLTCFTGGGELLDTMASSATKDLFCVLDRENELGTGNHIYLPDA